VLERHGRREKGERIKERREEGKKSSGGFGGNLYS
jgi:hypothetical protein